MTDEEMAIKGAEKNKNICNGCEVRCSRIGADCCAEYDGYLSGFVDGLAKGRKELEQWKQEWQDSQIKANEEGFARTTLQIKYSKLEKENAESKQILYKLVNAFNDYECAGPEQEQENTWEILRDLMHEELFKLTTRNKEVR